ncbi:MAG: PilZ domain-containing protein [Phycisphaerales bacterium]
MHAAINRRRFERFNLPCAYTSIALRTLDSERFEHEGHAYDISEGGVQFELDRGIEPGTAVAIRVDLPTSMLPDDMGPGRSVFIMGNIVWMDDSDVGPARMALAITRFARQGDRERLIKAFAARRLSRAA